MYAYNERNIKKMDIDPLMRYRIGDMRRIGKGVSTDKKKQTEMWILLNLLTHTLTRQLTMKSENEERVEEDYC